MQPSAVFVEDPPKMVAMKAGSRSFPLCRQKIARTNHSRGFVLPQYRLNYTPCQVSESPEVRTERLPSPTWLLHASAENTSVTDIGCRNLFKANRIVIIPHMCVVCFLKQHFTSVLSVVYLSLRKDGQTLRDGRCSPG